MRRVWITFALLAVVALVVFMKTGGAGGISVTVDAPRRVDASQVPWGPTAGLLVVVVGFVVFAIMLLVRLAKRLVRWLTGRSKRHAETWD